MERVIIDSNVIIAYFDDANSNYFVARSAITENMKSFGISTITLAECLVFAFRNGYELALKVLEDLRNLVSSIYEVSSELAVLAAKLRAEFEIHLLDALILATAEHHELELWTFDRRLAAKSLRAKYLISHAFGEFSPE